MQELAQFPPDLLMRANARRELDRIALEERYRNYTPNGKVEQFVNMVGSGETFISLFSAANGVGKTAAGANIVANLLFPKDNKWFDQPLFKKFPYLKRGRIISDATTIKEQLVPELESWLPKNRYVTANRGKSYPNYWATDTGFEFDLMTYDQAPKEFESVSLGWAWFDEPPPEDIYKATVSRMRRGGVIFITATPLTGSAWMYDQIITNPEGGQRDFVEADIEDNCIEHGVRGILKHSDIERMIAEYSEEDKQARVHGKFQHLTGLVFKMFNRKVHVIPPFEINPRDFCVYQRLDPHPRNEDSVGWYAVNRWGQKFIVDELYFNPQDTADLAYRINQKDSLYRIIDRKIDPSAFIEDQHQRDAVQGQSLVAKLEKYGLHYLPGSKQRELANRRIQDALAYRKDELGEHFIKTPEMFAFNTCVRHIWEFEHWQYNEWSGKTGQNRDRSEKPQDKNDHEMENTGRFLIDEPEFVPYTEPIRELERDNRAEELQDSLDPYE